MTRREMSDASRECLAAFTLMYGGWLFTKEARGLVARRRQESRTPQRLGLRWAVVGAVLFILAMWFGLVALSSCADGQPALPTPLERQRIELAGWLN